MYSQLNGCLVVYVGDGSLSTTSLKKGILYLRIYKVGPYDRDKWRCNPYKWPYKWVTGILNITLHVGVITPFITEIVTHLVGIYNSHGFVATPWCSKKRSSLNQHQVLIGNPPVSIHSWLPKTRSKAGRFKVKFHKHTSPGDLSGLKG